MQGNSQDEDIQSNHFSFKLKQHTCAKIQHMCIRSCRNCDQIVATKGELVFFSCLETSRRSIPGGVEYKIYFEAKHGRRERERKEHLPPTPQKRMSDCEYFGAAIFGMSKIKKEQKKEWCR